MMQRSIISVSRLATTLQRARMQQCLLSSTSGKTANVVIEQTKAKATPVAHKIPDSAQERVLKESCGDITEEDEDDDDMEEMFVEAHTSLGHGQKEWGGPTRGGRLAEPTRFGDWERKGRCTDF